MSNYITTLENSNEDVLLPRTKIEAISDSNGNYLDNQLTASDINALKVGKIVIPGSIIWYSGILSSIPLGYLVCNGQSVSRTTYSNLFNVIGTKYGSGDGSTTFGLPDLSDGNGRFIRAGFTDAVIGTKQDDKIRNITGKVNPVGSSEPKFGSPAGAFTTAATVSYYSRSTDTSGVTRWDGFSFSANANTDSYGNPMASHADGTDIHPYDIYFIPLIAY